MATFQGQASSEVNYVKVSLRSCEEVVNGWLDGLFCQICRFLESVDSACSLRATGCWKHEKL
jgi:hypothetical protein